jgi:hypothetical protein
MSSCSNSESMKPTPSSVAGLSTEWCSKVAEFVRTCPPESALLFRNVAGIITDLISTSNPDSFRAYITCNPEQILAIFQLQSYMNDIGYSSRIGKNPDDRVHENGPVVRMSLSCQRKGSPPSATTVAFHYPLRDPEPGDIVVGQFEVTNAK